MKKIRVFMMMLVVLAVMAVSVNAGVIFQDDFDSYGGVWVDTLPNASGGVWTTAPWGTGAAGSDVKVGDLAPGKAYFSNGYYADVARFATVTTTTDLSDYTVSVEAWAHGTTAMPRWYAAGRVAGGNYIAAGVAVGSGEVYLDFKESTGTEPSAMWYVADWNMEEPIYIDLTLSGDTVTATVTHVGFSVTQSYTTSILDAGAFGFGGHNPWGYATGEFDNFSVIPEPATMALLSIGFGLISLKKKKQV